MLWPCSPKRPHPSWAGGCPPLRSPRRCAAAANATSAGAPDRSATRCASRGWPPRSRPPTPFGAAVAALVPVLSSLNAQIKTVEARLVERFKAHPYAELLLSLPGLGAVLGARALAELGAAPDRYADARARRNYAGAAPVTRASGASKAVSARFVRNKRLFDALWQWSLCALSASPGARAYYDARNPGPRTSKTARRKLANKLVGILHGCLAHQAAYDEQLAWSHWIPQMT